MACGRLLLKCMLIFLLIMLRLPRLLITPMRPYAIGAVIVRGNHYLSFSGSAKVKNALIFSRFILILILTLTFIFNSSIPLSLLFSLFYSILNLQRGQNHCPSFPDFLCSTPLSQTAMHYNVPRISAVPDWLPVSLLAGYDIY